MEGPGIEKRWRARAEPAALIQVVEPDYPGLAVGGLVDEEPHRDTHPEKLRRFQPAGLLAGFVHDEIPVVEGLDAEEVEIHVRRRVDRIGEHVEIERQQFRREAVDRNPVPQVALERLPVRRTQPLDPVAHDFPVQHLLVDIGEHNPRGELREIRVQLDQRARVEDDRVFQDVLADLSPDRTAEFALDLDGVEVEVEPDHRELDAALEFGPIPENILPVPLADDDQRLLLRRGFVRQRRGLGAEAGPLGAVKNVALGDLVIPLAHQFLLDHVLDIFDMDEGMVAEADPVGHRAGNARGGFRIFFGREKRLPAGRLDFCLDPRNYGAVAPDQAHVDRCRQGVSRGRRIHRADRTLEDEALRHVVCVVLDQCLLDQQRKIVLGKLQSASLANLLEEPRRHRVSHVRDKPAVLLVENILLLARKKKVGQRVADLIRDIREIEGVLLSRTAVNKNLRVRNRVLIQRIPPGKAGLLFAWGGDKPLEGDVFVEGDVADHEEVLRFTN